MFTNNVNALPVTESDRRVCVIQNPATPRSPEYYTQLYATLRDREFLASVWALFRTRDLSRYNPGAIARITAAKERMAEDSRTEEQRIAIAFVRAAPFDCILAPDLAEVLVPSDTLHESKKERHLRISAVTRVLQDIGICTADRKLYVEGQPRNVWILRDVDSWRSASAAKLHEAVELTRAELQKHNWKVVTALEAWTRSEPAITAPNKPDFDPGS